MHTPALRARAVPFLLLVLSLFAGLAMAAETPAPSVRPITHEDLWLMKRPGALTVSPDGRWFVVAVTEPAYEEGQGRSDLWLAALDGSGLRRLTTHDAGDSSAFPVESSSTTSSPSGHPDESAGSIWTVSGSRPSLRTSFSKTIPGVLNVALDRVTSSGLPSPRGSAIGFSAGPM